MRADMPIGIFDSGLGGLTVANRIIELLPHENVVYFGDTARVPYGTRTDEIIVKYARQDMAFLTQKGVKLAVAACGTVSSVAGSLLRDSASVPFFEVISAAAQMAAQAAPNGRIGIIGTTATIRSHSHLNALKKLLPVLSAVEQPCPLFVPLVENGYIQPDNPIALETAKCYLKPFIDNPPTALILGCTHFPLLAPLISALLPDTVLIDPALGVARQVRRLLEKNDALNPNGGKLDVFVSENSDDFERFASAALCGRGVKCHPSVNIESY